MLLPMRNTILITVVIGSCPGFADSFIHSRLLQQGRHSTGNRLWLTTAAADDETGGGSGSNDDGSRLQNRIHEPEIYSKQILFGNGYNAVTVSAVDEEFSAEAIGQRNLPKGIERVQPSELMKKETQNDGMSEESAANDYEIVDKFRFKIDPDALRSAILQKKSLKARQELTPSTGAASLQGDNVPLSAQEISFDASFLEKLAANAVVDDSSGSVVVRLQLDYDEFERMVNNDSDDGVVMYTADDEQEDDEDSIDDSDDDVVTALFNSNAAFVDRGQARNRRDLLQYSSSRMEQAERFIEDGETNESGEFQWYDNNEKQIGCAQLASHIAYNPTKPPAPQGGPLGAVLRTAMKVIYAAVRPERGLFWADVSHAAISESVYGTTVIGLSLTTAIFVLDTVARWLVHGCQSVFNLFISTFPFLRARRTQLERSSKPVVFVAIILLRLLWHLWQRHVEHNRFKGIGYKVPIERA